MKETHVAHDAVVSFIATPPGGSARIAHQRHVTCWTADGPCGQGRRHITPQADMAPEQRPRMVSDVLCALQRLPR